MQNVLTTLGQYSSYFVLNDNNTQYMVYIEGYSPSGLYGQQLLNTQIRSTREGREEPLTIVNPPINGWILTGEEI